MPLNELNCLLEARQRASTPEIRDGLVPCLEQLLAGLPGCNLEFKDLLREAISCPPTFADWSRDDQSTGYLMPSASGLFLGR